VVVVGDDSSEVFRWSLNESTDQVGILLEPHKDSGLSLHMIVGCRVQCSPGSLAYYCELPSCLYIVRASLACQRSAAVAMHSSADLAAVDLARVLSKDFVVVLTRETVVVAGLVSAGLGLLKGGITGVR